MKYIVAFGLAFIAGIVVSKCAVTVKDKRHPKDKNVSLFI
jgi:hypothetical protein